MTATTPVAAESHDKKPIRNFFSGAGCWGSLVVIGFSLFLFLLACVTPAMVFDKDMWFGIQVFVLGWQGLFLGQLGWFANLFWLLSLLLAFLRRWFLTLAATLMALLIALDAFSFVGATVPLDEGFVNKMTFESYQVGFYFWFASIAAIGIGAVAMWIITRRLAR